MELRHLSYFRALAEELHFGKAADKLHIAQPALSRQIRELEDELGVTLFDRNRRKVILTAAGRYLHKQTNFLLNQVDEIKLELLRIRNMEIGTVRIGYVATAMYSIMPEFLSNVKKRSPELQLSLSEMTTREQVQAVRDGILELGFARCPVNDDSVAQKIVWKESFSLVFPADHPLVNVDINDLSVLKDEPFVFFPRNYNPGYYDKTISLCYRAGFSPKIRYEGVGSHTLLQMVASGLGITILPSSIGNIPDNRVKYRSLDFLPETAELAIIYDDKRLPPFLRELVLAISLP